MAYANLAMNILLIMAENARVMDIFCGEAVQPIRLCRQVRCSLNFGDVTRFYQRVFLNVATAIAAYAGVDTSTSLCTVGLLRAMASA